MPSRAVKRKGERRDNGGPIVLMAEADGYVMARRPGCLPFVMWAGDWDAFSRLCADPDTDTLIRCETESGARFLIDSSRLITRYESLEQWATGLVIHGLTRRANSGDSQQSSLSPPILRKLLAARSGVESGSSGH